MEIILHTMGMCSDTHSHFNVLDVLVAGGLSSSFVFYLKIYLKTSVELVKDLFRTKPKQ